MPFFTLVNVSLFSLLAVMNPFWLVDPKEVHKGLSEAGVDPKQLAFLPTNTWEHVVYYLGWGKYLNPKLLDGRGLNESLQNFWMVIHPPTLFVGYSSMMIPSAFALGALMSRQYDRWVTRVMPWLAFSWMVLGTGLFLGAYWAYETLGWGGYWSWDPVENASIVPWFVGTALIHGLVAQRNKGNYKQANLFLALMAGTSVVLGSFIVRSGVLGETSVHAFASPQGNVFAILLGMLILWPTMSLAIFIWRFKDIRSEDAFESTWERHFGFFLGILSLSAIALIIMFGVTLPIWQPWLPFTGGGKPNVTYTFYNRALLPVTFGIVLLMALTPLMPWKQSKREEGPRPHKPFNRVWLVLCGAVTVAFLMAAGWAWTGGFQTRNDPAYIVVGLAVTLALITNFLCLNRSRKGGLLNTGPWVAHIGFLVMLGGVIVTSRFNTTHSFTKVAKGETVTVLGRQFSWEGQRPASGPGDRDRMLIDMKMPDGRVVHLAPKLFISKVNNQTMAWPQIINEWFGGAWGDVYVEPTGVDNSGTVPLKDVAKNIPTKLMVQYGRNDPEEEVIFTFESLEMGEMQKALQSKANKPFTIYANVSLNVNGTLHHEKLGLRVIPEGGSRLEPVPVRMAGLNQSMGYSLQMTDLDPNPSDPKASFVLTPDVPVVQGYFQVLHVPGIQILWYGIYIMLAGAFLCWRRRVGMARQPVSVRERERAVEKGSARNPAAEPVGAE
jgi:cytochrome c-type biogenesis protein CcmF